MTYLDAASAVPLHPAAQAAWAAALADGWADPKRLYREGRLARRLLDAAGEEAAGLLGVQPDELSFPASGSAAVHLGVLGTAAARRRHSARVVHSAVEHSAVLHAAAQLEPVSVPVDGYGVVDLDRFAAELTAGAALGCLISASHEVGTVQPVAAAAEAAAASGVPLLVDAAQSLGRVQLPTGWSVLTGSARKWGGPPGVGLLVVRRGVRWTRPGPADEDGARLPGGVDLPAVVGAVAALRAATAAAPALDQTHRALTDRLRRELPRRVPDLLVHGHPTDRLPNLVSFSCLYLPGEALLLALDRAGFAVSSGSSCTASAVEPSHVLVAMGAVTHGNIRVSLHPASTGAEVAAFLDTLPRLVAQLRDEAGVAEL